MLRRLPAASVHVVPQGIRVFDMRREKNGFTLVELLVVIAIIGILVALLLPAIQAARESARATQCKNNLRQLGLGVQMHVDALGIFPTAGRSYNFREVTLNNGGPATGAKQNAGWAFQLLPYIEQIPLWSGGSGLTPEENYDRVAAHPVDTFYCPTRRPPQTYPDYYWNEGDRELAKTDYAGSLYDSGPTNNLFIRFGGGVMLRYSSDLTDEETPIPTRTIQTITDGLSNTMVLGEKRLNVALLGSANDDNEAYIIGWDQDVLRRVDKPPAPDTNRSDVSTVQGTGQEQFGSSHPAQFNIVLCDGSVRGISFEIDPEVFLYLGHIADGEVFELP